MGRFATLRATLAFTGAIIGVGIFGVPYVFAQAGFAIASIFFIFITLVILLKHLMYAEIIERTGIYHRLPGYIEIYFGKAAKNIIGFAALISQYGVQLAYIIIANEFLNTLFGHLAGLEYLWGVVFAVIFSVGIAASLKIMARGQVALTALLILTLGAIVGLSLPHISMQNFTSYDFSQAFLPYGVILFALVGSPAIPEIHAMFKNGEKRFWRAIAAGSLLAAILTFIFGAVVAGVSGPATSFEAISGLSTVLGKPVIYLGAIMGLLAITTSFLIFGINLKETFYYDWKLNRILSDALAIFVPLALFLLGLREFIEIIGVTGAVFGALIGSVIVLLFMHARKHGKKKPYITLHIPDALSWAIIAAFVFGGIYEIVLLLL